MNNTNLIGRLTEKVELRYTLSNKAVTSFSIAVNTGYGDTEHTDFIKIQAWNKTAENVCNYLDKGSKVAIQGSIRTSKYEDKNGNTRTDTYVLADKILFLESKKQETKIENNNDDSIDEDPFATFGENITIDDNFLE